MEETTLLKEINIREKNSNLSKETIFGIPLWRIVRYGSRIYYLSVHSSYKSGTTEPVLVGKRRIKLFSGFWKYLFKSRLNIFHSFFRLVSVNGCYFDKFIDPLIEITNLKNENYLIVDSSNYVGDYSRMHKDHTCDNEGRTISIQILKNVMLMVLPHLLNKKITRLFEEAQEVYELPKTYRSLYNSKIAFFVADYLYYMFWYSVLRPQRVLIVFRESYFAQIAVCKRLKIPVAEFQHGITLDKTVSFTGDYDSRIDPDYFITFGSYWKGDNFGMTGNTTICTGWAYSSLVKRQNKETKNKEGAVLVISSPEISDMMLEALLMLSEWQPSVKYHIRLHPNESYNKEQKRMLDKISQAEIADNKQDSAQVLPLYNYVLGENSSVLYEALSMGCKVGLLNICGLQPPIDKPGISESFSIINNPKDYNVFLSAEDRGAIKESFYSEFDQKVFEDFLNKNM